MPSSVKPLGPPPLWAKFLRLIARVRRSTCLRRFAVPSSRDRAAARPRCLSPAPARSSGSAAFAVDRTADWTPALPPAAPSPPVPVRSSSSTAFAVDLTADRTPALPPTPLDPPGVLDWHPHLHMHQHQPSISVSIAWRPPLAAASFLLRPSGWCCTLLGRFRRRIRVARNRASYPADGSVSPGTGSGSLLPLRSRSSPGRRYTLVGRIRRLIRVAVCVCVCGCVCVCVCVCVCLELDVLSPAPARSSGSAAFAVDRTAD